MDVIGSCDEFYIHNVLWGPHQPFLFGHAENYFEEAMPSAYGQEAVLATIILEDYSSRLSKREGPLRIHYVRHILHSAAGIHLMHQTAFSRAP